MSIEVVLLLLRLLGALLLLAFFGVVAWTLYRDLRQAEALNRIQARRAGTLRVISAPDNVLAVGQELPLYPVTSIGRSAMCTVVIDDDFASSEHALITERGEQWWLEDLNSRNGTLLNEVLIETAVVLSAGDLITVGRTQFRIEF
ncbi:MAG: FHA domain-containing protein [Candidatus Promineifilaceae bacterium]|nr:FHA domain-containing protein [Candidatus Promineifilaceae bacterium]